MSADATADGGSESSIEGPDNTDQAKDGSADGDSPSEEQSQAQPGVFKAITDRETLEALLDPVGRLVDECKIHLEEDSVQVRAVDPSNVGMIDLELESSAFESYAANGPTTGVNIAKFEKIMGMANKDQQINLDLDEESRTLHIEFGGAHYQLALIDPASIRKEPDIPDLPLPAEVTTEWRMIDRGIRFADMVAENVILGVDAETDEFRIEAEGDADELDIRHDENDGEDSVEAVSHDGESVDSLFSLDYLGDMRKAIGKSGQTTVRLGNEYPVKITFGLDGADGEATYMLAPRIQSN